MSYVRWIENIEIMYVWFYYPFCHWLLKYCCLLSCNGSKLFSMCSGCFGYIGYFILMFLGPKCEFCKSGTDELCLSEINVETNRKFAWHLAWNLACARFHCTTFFWKLHVVSVVSTRLSLAVCYHFKTPSMSSNQCTLHLEISRNKCMNNINNLNDEWHMRCYDTILDTGRK
jgi:hypothetical protein